MKIFVTGGTGYLGRRLVKALVDAGHQITCLSRSRERGRVLEEMGSTVVSGDVTTAAVADVDLSGFDAVIHSAALVKTRARDPRDFDRVNVEGVANVARKALDAGVGRFIYTSSFMALGPAGEDGEPLDESSPSPRNAEHLHNDYERTKYLGLLEFERWVERGLPGIALFPCVVYGPGTLTSGNIIAGAIAEFLLGRMPGVMGDGSRRCTYAHVNDVVGGHLAALERGRPGQRYILGGETVTMGEFMAMVAEAAGRSAPRFHIPFAVAKVAALVEEIKARLSGREPKLTREVVEIYKHHWAYTSGKAVDELGYKVTPLADGVRETVEWVQGEIDKGNIK